MLLKKNVAIILAAGKGERFGRKKQFIEFHGKTLVAHVFDKVKCLLPEDDIVRVGVDIDGGCTRSQSVINGLKYFQDQSDVIEKVIVLEAARPLVTIEQINRLLTHPGKSVTYVLPLINTVIKRDGTYTNRDEYYDLLTPQAFDYNLLFRAYELGQDWDLTDETRLMWETYQIKPSFIVEGQNLVKLTYVRDLSIIENLYNLQMRGEI